MTSALIANLHKLRHTTAQSRQDDLLAYLQRQLGDGVLAGLAEQIVTDLQPPKRVSEYEAHARSVLASMTATFSSDRTCGFVSVRRNWHDRRHRI
jgi:hypothetical protein